MRPPRPAPRPQRGRPPNPKKALDRSYAWRFLLERGPDFRGTHRRADALLADFLAFAAALNGSVGVNTPHAFLDLLRAARRHYLKRPKNRARYDAAKRAATAQRAEARAAREAARKR